jgi:HAD superfamily hydrolase (TIGR01450 family)
MPEAARPDRSLADDHDVVLLDLDGVVYSGDLLVPGAGDALAAAERAGMARVFVTNNASRTPQAVAAHLTDLGIAADADDVVTSAQAAAGRLAETLPTGARVLVVGGEGLLQALRDRGLEPVGSAEDDPVAVVQGFSPGTTWQMLMEACVSVRAGLPWVVTNADATLPTPRGEGPGNGAFVDVVRRVTGREPGEVAGKPFRPIMDEARRRRHAQRALLVGDRLDTDIEAARAAGIDALLVLTGVTGVAGLLACPSHRRPTFVGADLAALLRPGRPCGLQDGWWRCGAAAARVVRASAGPGVLETVLELAVDGEQVDPSRSAAPEPSGVADLVHAAAAACWDVDDRAVDRQTEAGRLPAASDVVASARRALSPWAAPLGWDR